MDIFLDSHLLKSRFLISLSFILIKGFSLYLSLNCSIYQGVFNKLRLATTTSVLIFSTSCKYHNGNVSLSPFVKRIEFGSHVWSILYAISHAI